MCADPRLPRRQRGLSLVEVMVGMVIALLVGLAASSSARVFTASQRQGVGVGGMTVNAATALAAIKGDVAGGGLGFFGDSTFMCYRLSLSVGATVRLDGANFAPVRITRVGSSDTLEVMYASEVDSGANLYLEGNSDGTTASLRSLMPVSVGQAVVLAPDPTTGLGRTCFVRTVTANTPSTDTTRQILAFGNTGQYNQGVFTAAPAFVDKDRVSLLGALRWTRYRLDGTNLRVDRRLDNTSAVIVRNVMAFRAQYGITDVGGTTLTGWQDATGATFADITGASVERVRALRIGIVTRSPQREKPNASGNCEASTAKPRDPLDPTVEVTPDVLDWQCYRFRSAVVVVPLRNQAW